MSLLAKAALKFAAFWSSRKLTSLRGTGASALPLPLSPSFTQYLPCSDGETALKCAIYRNEADVIAYLRSIGVPECRAPPALPLPQ